ncbi:MFS transporter [Pyrobaculum calidifontis]|uniref:Major facilitator superfamily MFS_1 n=1 Tax=Pyrobaculum calidifontis (strain DSM 21063 / JCM 11548 / VA1) TaxID=410359 RepID=A3MXK4_PYRCJ|nr:MFS transporter [Pyrobaculum calidifontis]ABO09371.1 major facilitator superfamily MFS_1 [Pyrobaculum calidifontis JCM 11548]
MDHRVLAIFLTSFVTPFVNSTLSIALPQVAREFGIPPAAAVSLLVVLTLAVAALALPMGRLSDVVGAHRVFRAGLLVALAGLAASSTSPSLYALYAALALMGGGLAAVFGSNNALLVQIAPPGRRASVVGMNSMFVYIGLVSGPLVGGLLASVSWRLIFLPAVVLTALAHLLVGPPPAAPGRGAGYDWPGALLLSSAVVLLVMGFANVGLALTGLVLLALAVVLESRREAPILNVRLFKDVVFASSVASAFLNYLSTAALTPALSLLYQSVYGVPPGATGALLSVMSIAMAVFAPLAGRLSDRYQPALLAAAGSAILAASLFLYSRGTPIQWAPLYLFAIGLGFALFIVPNTTIILTSAPPGVASAMVAEARVLGQSASNSLAAYVLQRAGGLEAGVYDLLTLLGYFAVATAALSLARYLRRLAH